MTNWPPISEKEIIPLNDITLVLHLASQFLGGAGKSLVTPEDDFSHTSMRWDQERGWFIGKVLPSKQVLYTVLDTNGMILRIINEHKLVLHSFELTGKTFEEGIHWIKATLAQYAINTKDYKLEMEDDIPDHPLRHGKTFPLIAPSEFELFRKARNIGQKVIRHYADQYDDATPVETWPHHFDIGSYIPLKKEGEETTHSMTLGMAVKDPYVNEHYFYITHWAKAGGIQYDHLPELPSGGYWNRKDFTGAMLPFSEVIKANHSPEDQWLAVKRFMDKGISASKQLLGIND